MSGSKTDPKEPAFEVSPGVDITRLPLTPEEGFVLSRLAGRRLGIADLTRETSMHAADVKKHVESLLKKGAVALRKTDAPAAPRAEKPAYDGMVFSPADLADGPDLTEVQKKRILYVEAHLDSWNYYTLLGLKRTASGAEIKSGYFKASKEFHPDAFFRKNIGRYAERVDRIFRAMKAAYDTLSKPAVRAAYDETLVGEFTPEELAELEAIADEKRREAERAARMARNDAARKAQRLKWNPMAQRLAKARELFQHAEEARKSGKLEEAANLARLAVGYDESLKVRAEPVLEEADAARAAALLKKIHAGLQYGDKSLEAEIHKAADAAAELAEHLKRPLLLIDVARVMQTLKKPQRAFRLANLAVERDDTLVAAWAIVAEVAAQDEKWALASRAAERWQALEPMSPRPKDILKQAKAARS